MTDQTATQAGNIRDSLGEVYSRLKQKWEEAEELLLSYQIPEEITIRIQEPARKLNPSENDDQVPHPDCLAHDLGYVKHYGKWALCYGLSADDVPGSLHWISIQHGSAEQQVAASPFFPKLLEKVEEAAEQYALQVRKAVSILEISVLSSSKEAAYSNRKNSEQSQSDDESYSDDSPIILSVDPSKRNDSKDEPKDRGNTESSSQSEKASHHKKKKKKSS